MSYKSNPTYKKLGIYIAPQRLNDDGITNLMDIRLSLNEATANGNVTANASHHHYSFFHHHHHGSININLSNNANTSSTSNHGQTNANANSAQQSHLHNIISGSASSAFNALMGHHHHHHHHHGAAANAQNNQYNAASSPLTLGTAVGNSASNPSTSASGSQSAGVLGTISFGMPTSASGNTTASSGQEQQQHQQNLPHSPTPPLQRRLAKSFSVAPNLTQQKGALLAIVSLQHNTIHYSL